uniref:FTH domain-containing protein n=1 Tax=Caenorhabditis tropicalis TaxID=1561998 RepID=A0A1I7V130_9PELO
MDSKPLTYQCLQHILPHMSFLKRKELYAKCPAIRKQEEQLGYRINEMTVHQYPGLCEVNIDNFDIVFDGRPEDETKKCGVKMTVNGITVRKSIDVDPEEAAERWATYILNRPGTRIQDLKLYFSPICMLKVDQPMTVINLTMNGQFEKRDRPWIKTTVPVKHLTTISLTRDETIKTAESIVINQGHPIDPIIFSELQATQILVNAVLNVDEIISYLRNITPRPIGFRFTCSTFRTDYFNTLDYLADQVNGRKTLLDGR